jgi:hypothetical protein
MQDHSRWWEFYFVRYAIGTLVGALIVNQAPRISPQFGEIIFFGVDMGEEIFAGVSMLFGYGLLFCYIASIPILVWHSARFVTPRISHFTSRPFFIKHSRLFPLIKDSLSIGIIGTFGIVLISLYQYFPANLVDGEFIIQLVVVTTLAVLWLEWGALIWLIVNMERAYQSLKSLAIARAENQNTGGFIDSYRHLREHGNSILIVFLEFVLGAVLLGMLYSIEHDASIAAGEKIKLYAAHAGTVLALWMLPGAVIWQIAVSFERRFVEADGRLLDRK